MIRIKTIRWFYLAVCIMFLFVSTAYSDKKEFDHFSTGFPLTGAHTSLDCEKCHVQGMFKKIARQCVSCHGQGGMVAATAKPRNHINSTNNCESCHTVDKFSTVKVDHSSVVGNCAACHNGTTAGYSRLRRGRWGSSDAQVPPGL